MLNDRYTKRPLQTLKNILRQRGATREDKPERVASLCVWHGFRLVKDQTVERWTGRIPSGPRRHQTTPHSQILKGQLERPQFHR